MTEHEHRALLLRAYSGLRPTTTHHRLVASVLVLVFGSRKLVGAC
jgi:hypothetical protein